MEKELFEWSEWDGDAECMTFYEPVLLVQIGKFPPGTKFDSATIIQSEKGNFLQFDNRGPEEPGKNYRNLICQAVFELHVVVGKQIN